MGSRRRRTTPDGEVGGPRNPLASLVESAEADPRDFVGGGAPSPFRPGAAQTLPYDRLAVAPGHNPRTAFAREPLERLAETIAAIGLQQPIAVRPARNGRYLVISGERRYRAIGLLVEAGRLPEDHPVPVFVRDDLDANGLLVAALVENLQREELSPLDEAEAYARLKAAGMGTGELAKAVGRSTRHLQARLQLLSLADPVREALRSGEIPVTVARVIAGMPQDLQGRALHHFRASELPFRTAEALRRWVRTEVVPFDAALFDRGEYLREAPDAVYVSDSGGKDPGARGRYFVDRELFLRLQSQAVDGLRRELRERFEWVEELEGWDLPDRLEEAPEGAGPGAVILFRKGLFDVVVFGGVARALGRGDGGSSLAPLDPPVTDDAAPAGQGSALGEPKPGQAPSPDDVPPHLALQEAIARDIGVALRLTVAGLLSGRCSPAPGLLSPTTPDGGLELAPTSRRQLQVLVGPLGLDRPEEVLALACGSDGPDEDAVYQVLQTLPWASVEGVLAALVAASMAASPAAGGGSSGLSPLLARLARELDLAVGAPASPTG